MNVLVVGNGMAGARVAQEVHRRGGHVTVLGAESAPAYNRVLLSDVLAGRRRAADTALTGPPVPRHLGVRVVDIDRAARTVSCIDSDRASSAFAYDHLVLATGSEPVVPPVHGIAGPDGTLLPGVFVFRTLADCAAIADAVGRARRAVVVGGGLLGLEAARGLLGHGLAVEIVHGGAYLLDAQLDPLGGAVLRRAVHALGVGVQLGAVATAVTGTRSVTGVTLADGRHVAGDLVVLACGVRPRTDLARRAGLEVERGIVVDDRLRTCDADISAVGECVQHRGAVYGLVAPAWEQAAVLAEVLAGRPAAYTGSRPVARLKALDLDVAAMGEVTPELADTGEGLEVVQYADPARHVYSKLVLRDEVLVGAVLLGDLSPVGRVTQAFDRRSRVRDPRTLLFPRERGGGPPADDAVVCTCNGVTAGALRTCGAGTLEQAARATGATTGCGTCTGSVTALLAPATLGQGSTP